MPTPDDFFSEHKTLTMGSEADPLKIVYDPAAVLFHDAPLKDDTEQLATWLANVVVSWNLTGPVPARAVADQEVGAIVAAGEVIPLEVDALSWLSLPSLFGFVGEITRDALPNRRGTAPASPRPEPRRTSTPSRSKRAG